MNDKLMSIYYGECQQTDFYFPGGKLFNFFSLFVCFVLIYFHGFVLRSIREYLVGSLVSIHLGFHKVQTEKNRTTTKEHRDHPFKIEHTPLSTSVSEPGEPWLAVYGLWLCQISLCCQYHSPNALMRSDGNPAVMSTTGTAITLIVLSALIAIGDGK